jgi:paraquat-inducible protein A
LQDHERDNSALRAAVKTVVCPCCDSVVELPDASEGLQCRCPVCGALLRPAREVPLSHIAVMAFSALLMLVCSLNIPFMSVGAAGVSASMSLATIISVLSQEHLLLGIFVLVTFVFPIYLLAIAMLTGFFAFRPGRMAAKLYSVCHRFTMIDVFVLGVAVSLVKLTQLADVSFHAGFFIAMFFSCILIWCWLRFRPARIWELYRTQQDLQLDSGARGSDQGIVVCRSCGLMYRHQGGESSCPRCGAKNRFRQRMWGQRTAALILAAAVLFLPSNLYPIMFTDYMGSETGSNIVEGVISLWDMGSWFVASVVVLASLFIPAFKILAVSYLMICVKKGSITHPRLLSVLYRIVEFIGKWSMIDVFVVIIMSTAVRMGGLLTISPGMAIVTFCLVVMLTMFAASEFDERLIWDNCAHD